jgi:diguanylate cyclase (GGDEF)-like protein/PAS domain S-box-containing protein/excisionase family DNA binding protein
VQLDERRALIEQQEPYRFLGTGSAAKRLGVSRHTLMRAVRRGKIQPAILTPGGRMRFRAEDVEAFAQQLSPVPVERTLGPDLSDLDPEQFQLLDSAAGQYDAYVEAFFQVPAPLSLLELDGSWILVNPAFCTLLGYTQNALLTLGPAAVTHPADRDNALAAHEKLLGGQARTSYFDARYCRVDGDYVWVYITVSLVTDDSGAPLYYVHQMQDITQQKLADQLRRASEERLRSVVTNAPVALLAVDDLGTVTVAEGSALATLGFSALDLVGRPIAGIYGSQTDILALVRRALAGESAAAVVSIGSAVVDSRWVPQRDERGRITGAIGISTDITMQHTLVENAPVGACISDDQGTFEVVNTAYAAIFGFAVEELLGKHVDAMKAQVQMHRLATGSHDGARPAPEEFELINKKGVFLVVSCTDFSIIGADSRPRRASFVLDITDQKRNEQRLSYAANHDMLTGLPNRALFYDRLEHALHIAARERTSLAVFQIDLDRFKTINDRYGHAAGDQVLKMVAQRISEAVRASDTVARLGGDEFAVILPQADEAGALQVAGKIRASVFPLIELGDCDVSVGASVGISLYPEHAGDGSTLMHYADQAMYLAKSAGGGAAVHSREQVQDPGGRTLAAEQREAIHKGQLFLVFQPIVDCRNERTSRVEALVRWQHPTLGMLEPDKFIALAEQTGAIVGLTLWVLEQALRQAGEWRQSGLHLGVSVNLSMHVLLDSQLPDLVAALLREYPVDPSQLTFEISEPALLRDPEPALVVIHRLAALGVRIALDDVGASRSSFDVVSRLPLHEMKIDRSIVRQLSASHGPALIGAVIGVGQALGLNVVAKGVEDLWTWERLSALGCATMQGYYISHPLPPEQLADWLRAREPIEACT